MWVTKPDLRCKRVFTWVASLFLLSGASACTHSKLHETFGRRSAAVFQTQSTARSSREVYSLGTEVQGAVGKYYQTILPDANGPSTSSGGANNSIAGVRMPLTSR